jgi:hypothetical protein
MDTPKCVSIALPKHTNGGSLLYTMLLNCPLVAAGAVDAVVATVRSSRAAV